jgi:hypothetical protein
MLAGEILEAFNGNELTCLYHGCRLYLYIYLYHEKIFLAP